MLTILTWLWNQPGGRTSYGPEHVNIWAAMVRRHLSIPHRIACVTDLPGIDSGIEIIPPPREFEDARIPTWGPERPQCLRRLAMFKPDAARIFGERFVCMDLDVVIGDSLDPLFDTDADFKICKSPVSWRPYNGSMMLIRAGTRSQVYTEFTPERAVEAGQQFIGSDQAWISYILGPNEQTWSVADGQTWIGGWRSSAQRIMFFPGLCKPWTIATMGDDEWVREHYRGSARGHCLVLGYHDSLWDDVEIALDRAPFDAVIASPEAAEHWPGKILAIAPTNEAAARLVQMHGFTDVTWCGMKEVA